MRDPISLRLGSRRAITAAALCLGLGLSSPGHAHGLWGHLHVTGWAAENMPNDELRQFLLDDPEVFNALLFGAVFTDTGYAVEDPASRAYSEHTHWEPFIEDYVEWIRINDPPPWDSLESKKRVAFLMGCASHGLQDSIFDSLFLHHVEQRDGAGQAETDPGTDGFLALDGHLRFFPEPDLPLPLLLELYQDLEPDVTEDVITTAVDRTVSFYINETYGPTIAATLGEEYAPTMPWGRVHYMDPAVPGSLRAEIFPTMRHQQALWKRLHGELSPNDVTVFAFPEEPRRLRSGDPERVDSWVTLIFGEGVVYDSALVELVDDAGEPVDFDVTGNRWGGNPTRLIRLLPAQTLTPGGWYTARLLPGAETSGGQVSTEGWEQRFQVACEDDSDPACPDLGDIPVASIDGVVDESTDSAEPGTGGANPDVSSGCGCAANTRTGSTGNLFLVGLFALAARLRTRRRAPSSAPPPPGPTTRA